jgi:homoserine/homoserine lactone efflux protein
MTFSTWLGFLLAAILIAVTPGPGAAISMSSGLRHGYRAALRAICGLQAAIVLHLLIVAIGLGAVLAASDTAFAIVKFAGGLYLVWLGIQKWRAPVVPKNMDAAASHHKNLFIQGLLVNLTNPKAIIFICALVPPFIDPTAPQWSQYLLIAMTLCLTDTMVMSVYALGGVRLARWLHDPHAIRTQNRAFGGLFISAGALLAISSRP